MNSYFFLFIIIITIIISGTNTYLTYTFYKKATYEEKLAPSDYIKQEEILIGTKAENLWTETEYYILIPLNQKPFVSKFIGTGSMKPTFDENANAIEIKPQSPKEIHEGDIISYKNNINELIVHRVITTGYDENGWYATTKGDNNAIDDGKIRFQQINGKIIILLY